jgi:hypothetical protein
LVLADQRRWGWAMPAAADRFVTVHTIDGAVEALTLTRDRRTRFSGTRA